MTTKEYQELAQRTECPQLPALKRLEDMQEEIPLLHAVIGISGEAGELSAAIERWLWYGKPLDIANIKEELGDLLWYIAEACNALEVDMESIMSSNIAKLKARYPDKYSDDRAAEENRNREAEIAASAVDGDGSLESNRNINKQAHKQTMIAEEKCGACGRNYPRKDMIAGHIFCPICRMQD